jgi:hypothetical protein
MSSVRFAPKGEEKPEPQWEHPAWATLQARTLWTISPLATVALEYENLERARSEPDCMSHRMRIMYIENKGGDTTEHWWGTETSPSNLSGPARIGRVTFSKTGRSLRYRGKEFSKANGFKANYVLRNGRVVLDLGAKETRRRRFVRDQHSDSDR